MDRFNPNVPACQIGFIGFIVQPLYQVLWKIIPESKDDQESLLLENLAFWQKQKSSKKSLMQGLGSLFRDEAAEAKHQNQNQKQNQTTFKKVLGRAFTSNKAISNSVRVHNVAPFSHQESLLEIMSRADLRKNETAGLLSIMDESYPALAEEKSKKHDEKDGYEKDGYEKREYEEENAQNAQKSDGLCNRRVTFGDSEAESKSNSDDELDQRESTLPVDFDNDPHLEPAETV